MTAIQPHNHHPVGLLKQKMRRRTYQIPGCHAKRTSHRIAAILISLICVWDAGSLAAHAENCSVEIFLAATDHKVFAQEGRLVDPKLLRVTIRNVGRQVITLVQPGDGSESGLRTPTVSWSVHGAGGSAVLQHFGMREDNLINPLEPKEVFTLEPNMEHGLSHWIPPIVVDGPGKYVVTLHYVNDPHLTWRGTPMRAHDAATMALVTESSLCDAVSGPMEIDVQATDVEKK
jgi:hypothetical protein